MNHRTANGLAIAAIVLLGVFHSVVSFACARTKSPTFDESIHALGGYAVRFLNDYRIDPEDPALWHRIHSLAARRSEVRIDESDRAWNEVAEKPNHEFYYAHSAYLHSADEHIDTIINRRRALLSVFGGATVIGAAFFARALAREAALPVIPAGIFTAGVLAFDPTLLAHSAIIKNDVMMALLTLGLTVSLWSIGRRISWKNATGVIVCVALAPLIKFSGVIFAPIALTVLAVRALLPDPLPLGQRTLNTRWQRIVFTFAIMIAATGAGYFALWASYGFQHSATRDGTPINFAQLIYYAKAKNHLDMFGVVPPYNDYTLLPIDSFTRLIAWAWHHHLAPQGWLFGVLQVHALTGYRTAYLFGQWREGGFWYYFPCAFLLKTPVANLLLLFGAMAASLIYLRSWRPRFAARWMMLAIGVPALFILAMSIRSGLNIGVRHILPLWPAIYVSIGLVCAWLWKFRSSIGRLAAVVLAAGGVVESVAAAPNFLSFFNVFCGGSTTRLNLLADSNLDWGQDLKGLGKWRREHPHVRLYFAYFGTVDPAHYDIDYINIRPRFLFNSEAVEPDRQQPAVIAYSANYLTGVTNPEMRDYFKTVRARKPITIIGGSIFLYKWPFDMPDDEWERATGISIDRR